MTKVMKRRTRHEPGAKPEVEQERVLDALSQQFEDFSFKLDRKQGVHDGRSNITAQVRHSARGVHDKGPTPPVKNWISRRLFESNNCSKTVRKIRGAEPR